VLGDDLGEELADGVFDLLGLDRFFQLGGDVVEGLRDDGVEGRERAADRLVGGDSAELELVAGEGEGRGAVAVARVLGQRGEDVDAEVEQAALLGGLGLALLQLLEDVGKLLAEVDGDDGRGRLVGAEAVVVGGRGDGGAEEAGVLVDGTDDRSAEDEELEVLVRGVAGLEEVALDAVAERPVEVLTGAVDAGEGFLVEEALHAVLTGHALERGHDKLLVVGGDVGGLVDRGELVLGGRDLVVAGFDGNTEFIELGFALVHVGEDAIRDDAEVLVFEFLALRRAGAEQGAAGGEQVGAGKEEVAVDQEVLLFRASRGGAEGDVGVTE